MANYDHIQMTDGFAGSSQTLTLPGNAVAGNSLILKIAAYGSGANTSILTDAVRTWTAVVSANDGTNRLELWLAAGVTAASVSVDVALGSGGAAFSWELCEKEGTLTAEASAADGPTAASGGPPLVFSTSSIGASAGALVSAAMTHDDGAPSLTAESGWTQRYENEDNNNQQAISSVDRLAPGGSISHTWEVGAALNGLGVIASLVVGGAPPSGGANRKRWGGVPFNAFGTNQEGIQIW